MITCYQSVTKAQTHLQKRWYLFCADIFSLFPYISMYNSVRACEHRCRWRCVGECRTSVWIVSFFVFIFRKCPIHTREQKPFVALSFYSLIWTTSSLPLVLHVAIVIVIVIVIVDGLCDFGGGDNGAATTVMAFYSRSFLLFAHRVTCTITDSTDGNIFTHFWSERITKGST